MAKVVPNETGGTLSHPLAKKNAPNSYVRALDTGRAALQVRGADVGSNFGPGQPLQPSQIDFGERQFDYLPSSNTQILPRANESTSFDQLRALADNCDVLRLVIETRKDQLAKIKWKIGPKDPDADATADASIAGIQTLFAFPDGFNDFTTWQRAILEDLFVLDAPCVYPDIAGGKAVSFELIDGATIKRVLDITGRTPSPPDPAYQQVIKGIVAANYTRDEMVYRPRNIRTNKPYGYGPVEQILMTINTLIRRSLTQLQAFTEGTVPDMIIGVPTDWSPDHIKQFQTYWDALLENNTALRAKARFVPGGMKPEQTKPNILSDMFDEWLARIVCFAFSISPQPFVKMMNKATAGTAQEQSLAEGLEPTKMWFKNFMDILIQKYLKRIDLEFQWDEEEAVDPLEQAQIAQIYVEAGCLTPDEVREQLGKDPLTQEQKDEISPPPPPMMPTDGSAPAPKPADGLNPSPPNAAAPAPSGAAKPPSPANKSAGVKKKSSESTGTAKHDHQASHRSIPY